MLADSSVWANWAVAAGTGLLALATWTLSRRARDEAAAVTTEAAQVGEQVALQRAQLEARQRAYVYPWLPHDWVMGTGYWNTADTRLALLPLKNAGPGVARNVRGRIVWNRQPGLWSKSDFAAGTIAAGDNGNARLSPPVPPEWGWAGARGFIRFVDLDGQEWATFFRFDMRGAGVAAILVGEHQPPEKIEGFDPDALDEANIAARTAG